MRLSAQYCLQIAIPYAFQSIPEDNRKHWPPGNTRVNRRLLMYFALDQDARLKENPATVRFDETEHGVNPWRARRCIRGRMLQG